MYNDYYHFKKQPFGVTPDPDFLYLSSDLQGLLSSLVYGINERRGFITIIGEIGTGKTVFINSLTTQLDIKIKIALIFNTSVSFEQLLDIIFDKLGVGKVDNHASIIEKISRLREFATHQLADGSNVVLIFDEAQTLSYELLENLRLLSNLETPKQKLFQIILSGLPALDVRLSHNKMRPLKKRIGLRLYISPLREEETYEYIQHRLAVAGYPDESLFSKKAIQLAWSYSGGIPRKINTLCDNVLMRGFGLGERRIGSKLMKEAIENRDWRPSSVYGNHSFQLGPEVQLSGAGPEKIKSRFWGPLILGMSVCLGLIIAAYFFYGNIDRNFQKAKSFGHLVTGKIQSILTRKSANQNQPVLKKPDDPSFQSEELYPNSSNRVSAQNTVSDAQIMTETKSDRKMHSESSLKKADEISPQKMNSTPEKKNGNTSNPVEPTILTKKSESAEDMAPARVEPNQDQLVAAVKKEPENNAPKTIQLTDQKSSNEAPDTLSAKTPSLSLSAMRRIMNKAAKKWGKVVFVRNGEDLAGIARRVYGLADRRLIEAILKENQHINPNSLIEGQTIRLPTFYDRVSTGTLGKDIGARKKQDDKVRSGIKKSSLPEFNDFLKTLDRKRMNLGTDN